MNSANSTSATSCGSTHTISSLRTRGIFGTCPNGRCLAPERLQLLEQPADLGVVEAGADVPDVRQLAALVHREDQRAERRRATAAALRVAGDEELLAPVRLDLQPVARAPALEVPRVGALGHDPLELLLRSRPRAAPRRRRTSRTGGRSCSGGRAAPRGAPAVRSAAGRRAARRRARAGRTRSTTSGAPPCCIAEKLARPRSSSAQTSPSRTASGDFTAFAISFATFWKRGVRSLSLRDRSVDLAAADVRERAIAVPLHLEQPSPSPPGTVFSSVASIGRYRPAK